MIRKSLGLLYASLLGLLLFVGISGAISSRVCIPGLACITGNGTYVFIDTDSDGILGANEPNLTINSPLGDSGDETIQGDLIVTGAFDVSGITNASEEMLFWYDGQDSAVDTNAGDANYSLVPFETYTTWNAGSLPVLATPVKTYLTRLCATISGGTVTIGTSQSAVLGIYSHTTAGFIGNTITFADSGGDITGTQEDQVCVTMNVTVNAGSRIQLRSQSSDATNFPRATFALYGYGID